MILVISPKVMHDDVIVSIGLKPALESILAAQGDKGQSVAGGVGLGWECRGRHFLGHYSVLCSPDAHSAG